MVMIGLAGENKCENMKMWKINSHIRHIFTFVYNSIPIFFINMEAFML